MAEWGWEGDWENPPTAEKTVMVCSTCGSENVLYDAYVAVNDPDDVRTFDSVTCEDCGKETSLVEKTENAE